MYKTNDTDKSEPLVLCTLSPWTIFLSWLWTCSFMKHSTNQHQWEDLYISEALGLLPLRLLLSPHLTAPPAITQWNTLAPGLKPTGILPIIISYIHTTAGVSASLGSLLSSLLSSVLYPPFSVCLSLSLLRLVYLRGKAFWFVWAMTGGRSAASRALRSVGMRGKQSPLAFLSFPRNQPEWLDESVSAFTEIYLWG